MRVFVTGATGFVGWAVVEELLRSGHQVLGLARSDKSADRLRQAGAEVVRGDLADASILQGAAAGADGVAHLGFDHDWANFQRSCELDRQAILALGEALQGSDRPLIVTSGVALLAPGRIATEADFPPPPSAQTFPRMSESTAAELVQKGVRALTLRLSPTVHGRGDHQFIAMLIDIARQKGEAAYIDDGQNRWPAVHREDAAVLYRLALESRLPAGTALHAVAEEGLPFREIEAAIGQGLGLPVHEKTGDDIAAYFGWFARFAGLDMAASSEVTRRLLEWAPTRPGLLQDIREGGYLHQ